MAGEISNLKRRVTIKSCTYINMYLKAFNENRGKEKTSYYFSRTVGVDDRLYTFCTDVFTFQKLCFGK
jgi:hypothetical protein